MEGKLVTRNKKYICFLPYWKGSIWVLLMIVVSHSDSQVIMVGTKQLYFSHYVGRDSQSVMATGVQLRCLLEYSCCILSHLFWIPSASYNSGFLYPWMKDNDEQSWTDAFVWDVCVWVWNACRILNKRSLVRHVSSQFTPNTPHALSFESQNHYKHKYAAATFICNLPPLNKSLWMQRFLVSAWERKARKREHPVQNNCLEFSWIKPELDSPTAPRPAPDYDVNCIIILEGSIIIYPVLWL